MSRSILNDQKHHVVRTGSFLQQLLAQKSSFHHRAYIQAKLTV